MKQFIVTKRLSVVWYFQEPVWWPQFLKTTRGFDFHWLWLSVYNWG